MPLKSATSESILVVDDEANLRKVLQRQLERAGYAVETAEDGGDALHLLDEEDFAAVLTDLRMAPMDGLTLLRRIAQRWPGLPVIMLTAHGSIDTAVEAVKLGAFDFIEKPHDIDMLLRVVAKAVRTRQLARAESGPLPAREGHGRFGIIGTSIAMQRVFEIVEKVASTPSTALITGESGTGKELVAKALHEHSPRAGRPFIKVNCAAIPDTLIESELFGYERGAFTGAVSSKPGRFELAHTGTLFLDEIGEVSTEMQVKLLRAIQEREFERVGGVSTRHVDVRLIAATNRDLAKAVAEGRFREDLFYRLNVVPIPLPPLRDRTADIPALVAHLLQKYTQRLAKPNIEGFDDEALELLSRYTWPGNIRELENVVERTLLFSDGPRIRAADLPAELTGRLGGQSPWSGPIAPVGVTALKDVVRRTTQAVEREMIERALGETGGNVTRSARMLEISRKSLQIKMKELGLRETEK